MSKNIALKLDAESWSLSNLF